MANWLKNRRIKLPPPTRGVRSAKEKKEGAAYLIYNRTGQSPTGYRKMEAGKVAMALRTMIAVVDVCAELKGEKPDKVLVDVVSEIRQEILEEDQTRFLQKRGLPTVKKPKRKSS